MEMTEEVPGVLKDLVRHFQVCWEVWPEELFVGNEKRQVGLALELCGTHGPGGQPHEPGCPDCQRVFAALHVIAGWILPMERRPSFYELAPFNPSLRYSPARGNRPDVTLTVKILHRRGFERPVDDCEIRCLKEMEQRLKELGAGEHHWIPRQENQP